MKIKLRELRAKRDLSYRELERLSGVSKSLLEKIESGADNPTAETLCKLAKALNVTLNDLVDCDH